MTECQADLAVLRHVFQILKIEFQFVNVFKFINIVNLISEHFFRWDLKIQARDLIFYRATQWRFESSGVPFFMNFSLFSPERKESGSSGATESEVWKGNFKGIAWKTTKHKLHKIWSSLKFCKHSGNKLIPGLGLQRYHSHLTVIS